MIFLEQIEIGKSNQRQLKKDVKKYIELNSENSRDYYILRRNAIKKQYEKENKNITPDKIKLEKERVTNRIESSNPSYLAIIISIVIMFLNMLIPNIAESIAKALVIDKFVSSAKVTIIILYSAAVFITLFFTVCKQLEEIQILKVLKSVIEEIEIEQINNINNSDEKNNLNEIKEQISDIEIFWGI